jgi:hypothetical protein
LPWAVKKAQVCFYLSDKTSSILCTRRASFFSAATLDFSRKNAVLTDQVFANPAGGDRERFGSFISCPVVCQKLESLLV